MVYCASFSGCMNKGTGQLILKITDGPDDLNISKALITISQVEVHLSAFGENDNDTNVTAGWYTVVNYSQTFDLINLTDAVKFFGSANLTSGWYTQIRLHIDDVIITIDNIDYNCSIPSGSIKIVRPFGIQNNQSTTLIMDFDVQQSVIDKGNGHYSFKPVIRIIQE